MPAFVKHGQINEGYKMSSVKTKIILLLTAFIANNTFALEITNYSVQARGAVHNVTVALDDLGKSAVVRCVIRKKAIIKNKGKPVGMEESVIKGVGTIVIFIEGGITEDTEVECLELK